MQDLDPYLFEQEQLLVETALAYCARACVEHSKRVTQVPTPSPGPFLHNIRLAAAWVSRCRASHGQGPIEPFALLDAMSTTPTQAWLPGGPNRHLLLHRAPTDLCEQIFFESGIDPSQEAAQKRVAHALSELRQQEDGEATYRAFRTGIIRHPIATLDEASRVVQSIRLGISDFYAEVQPQHLHPWDEESVSCLFPCPRCGYPMVRRQTQLRCASDLCFAHGARFLVERGGHRPLGALPLPQPQLAQGRCVLRPGIWRYTLLPGIEELELYERLKAIKGAVVELWPQVDQYDLRVTTQDRLWRIDFKDYSSCHRLAKAIEMMSIRQDLWIVVPDRSKSFVLDLRTRFKKNSKLHFFTASQLLRDVRNAK